MFENSEPLRTHRCCLSQSTGAHVAGRERVAEAWKVYLSGLLTSTHDPVSERAGRYLGYEDSRISP